MTNSSTNEARLRQILALPYGPVEQPTAADWALLENEWLLLPDDFKNFLKDYGSGCIADFIWLFNPASTNLNLNYSFQAERQFSAFTAVTPPGLKIYPSNCGFFPFGITDNGDLLGWKVDGFADSWHVAVVDSRASRYEEFPMSFLEFLIELLSANIGCDIFPKDFPSPHVEFRPA